MKFSVLNTYLLAGLFGSASALFAQPTKHTILTNGPSANRINLVVFSEGYSEAQLPQFLKDATNVVNQFFAEKPYNDYKKHFNAFAIAVASSQSGASRPDDRRNTYFNSSFDAAETFLTIPPNDRDSNYQNGRGKVDALLKQLAPEGHLPILLVNDLVSGGSGGSVIVVSKGVSSPEILVHESGHTFAGLGDEYDWSFPYPDIEEPNTTRTTNLAEIKWKHWITPGTQIPTPNHPAYANVVGLFEGAHYHTHGWYRPKLNCKMRELGAPFCEVCSETLVKTIYRKVRPIDSIASSAIPISVGEGVQVFLPTVNPDLSALSVQWFLNGTTVSGSRTSLQIAAGQLPIGAHTVRAEVRDNTSFVRHDPENLLKQTVEWTIFVRRNEILWTHSDGRLATWFMNGTNRVGAAFLNGGQPVAPDWKVATMADFNRDGQQDILWRRDNGQTAVWLMSGMNRIGAELIDNGRIVPLSWRLKGAADFDGDNELDLLWHHTDGRIAVWLMTGTQLSQSVFLRGGNPLPTAWQLVGTSDFDRDGKPDLLWQHTDGRLAIWLMNGTEIAKAFYLRDEIPVAKAWSCNGIGDLDGDGFPDLLWQHQDGRTAAWFLKNGEFSTSAALINGNPVAPGWRLWGVR